MPILENGKPPFADDELLYRRLRSDWVVDGEIITAAIKLPQCSVDRASLSPEPAEVLMTGNAGETGLAAVRVGALPDEIGPSPGGSVILETIVRHEPDLPDNNAHSEIRVRRKENAEPFFKNVHKKGKNIFRGKAFLGTPC